MKIYKALIIMALISLTQPLFAGHPCTHLLICCRGANRGITFEIDGKFIPDHDYSNIDHVRDIMQKLKDAGIKTVIVDMTNPSQWTIFRQTFEPMIENIQTVCTEKEMQFFFFIGVHLPEDVKEHCGLDEDAFTFWNRIAGEIYERWAKHPIYRRYGYGDDRPILLVFDTAKMYWPYYESIEPEKRDNLACFRIGTTQVNTPTEPGESDGWGYRSQWQNASGSVRLASPNGSVVPGTWYHIDAEEWEKQVRWAREASEYSIYGSYDDTCDSFFWGIADTSATDNEANHYPEPGNPRYYYDILKSVLDEH